MGGLELIEAWSVADFIRGSGFAYPLVNAAHILSLGMVIGAIATLDLRILGAFRTIPAAALAPPLAQVAAVGVLGALLTGFLLFSTRPVAYAGNAAFLLKIVFVSLGIANALLVRASASWRRLLAGAEPDGRLKLSAAVSLAVWISAVLAGRWIGFLE